MATKIITDDTALQNIADAIRAKAGTTEPIAVGNMAQAITDIPSGGSSKLPQVIDRSVAALTASDFGGVTIIGQSAFEGCTALTSVSIPNTIQSIGSSAFEGCSSLQQIIIPDSVLTLGSYAFNNCSSVQNITIGSGIQVINSYGFNANRGITALTIPNNIQIIYNYAFQHCTNLSAISLGTSHSCALASLKNGAFYNHANDAIFIIYARTAPTISSDSLGNVDSINAIYVDIQSTGYDSGNWTTYSSKIQYVTLPENGFANEAEMQAFIKANS